MSPAKAGALRLNSSRILKPPQNLLNGSSRQLLFARHNICKGLFFNEITIKAYDSFMKRPCEVRACFTWGVGCFTPAKSFNTVPFCTFRR